jgi:DNA repair protein RecN (Recombination protein N)
MLEELRLQALGVIDEAMLHLGPGFTAVTGETGAGKTMVVTALGLLLGARADSALVRSGARQARIEGRVALDPAAPFSAGIGATVDEVGGELDDDALLLTRTVSAEGRSRAVLGGAAVPVARLAEIADSLVAVHGQSDQHRLLRPAHQREALDRFAGEPLGKVSVAYQERYRQLRTVERELNEVSSSARERAREAEMLRIGLAELERAELTAGEDVALLAEERRLAHSEALSSAALEAQLLLTGDDDVIGRNAVVLLDGARKALQRVREHDPQAGGLADRLAELAYLSADLGSEVAGYAASVDADPARLGFVQQRRALIAGLSRKYGESVDDILVWGEQAARRLVELEGADDRILELEAARDRIRAELALIAAELSDLRVAAAERLSGQVTRELTALAMPHARLEARVTRRAADTGGLLVDGDPVAFSVHGIDEVQLLLAANPDAEPRPLDKGASGGELSRVMLAFEVVLADRNPVPTLVFDEVDAGVGGRAAVEVGRRLARLARVSQVLAVTHLPQVAAFADRHYVVVKAGDGTVTRSGLRDLDESARVQELSRMLAGVEESSAARAHAQELLEMAAAERHPD